MKQKEVFPCVRGGVKMSTQAIPPPPPPEADSCQKQADLGQKRLLPCDVVGHVTRADLV